MAKKKWRSSLPKSRDEFFSSRRGFQATPSMLSPEAVSGRLSRIARGSPLVPSSISRQFQRAISPVGGRTRLTDSSAQGMWDTVYNRLVNEYEQNQGEFAAIERAREEAVEEEDVPWTQRLLQAATMGVAGGAIPNLRDTFSENGPDVGGFAESPVGRALDIISRPSYALFGGMENLAGQETHRGYSPEDLAFSGRNFGSGFWRGLSGQDKTGFGMVYEALKENPESDVGEGLRAFEEAHPGLEQTVAQSVGLAGELGLDPLNFVMPASVPIIAGTGEVATEATLRAATNRAVAEVVDEFAGHNAGLLGSTYTRNPAALVARIEKKIGELYDDAILDVTGGGKRGTRLMNPRRWSPVAAARTAQEVRSALTDPFVRRVTELLQYGNTSSTYVQRVLRHINDNDDYADFWKRVTAKLNPNASIDEVLQAIDAGKLSEKFLRDTMSEVLKRYDPAMETIFDDVVTRTHNPVYRNVGIRTRGGGRPVSLLPTGRAYRWLNEKGIKLPSFGNDADRLLFEQQFPAIFGVLTGRVRALGMGPVEDFTRKLRGFAKDFTESQARELQTLYNAGVRNTGNATMDAGLAFLQKEYDRMYFDEIKQGARPSTTFGSRKGDNYNFIFNRGGSKAERLDFATKRKEAWNKLGTQGEFGIEYAKAHGLKPTEHAFENLLMRYIKSRRDMMRAYFMEDLLDNYSALSKKPVVGMGKKAVASQKLAEVKYSQLPQKYRQLVDAQPGSKFYLPQDIMNMYGVFNDLSSWSTADWGKLGRAYARVINVIKATQTLPFTGFHAKNVLGDVFMGLMDDIGPTAYSSVAKKWALNRAGKVQHFDMVPGLKYSYDQMWNIFNDNANAGFFPTEFGTYNSVTAGALPRRMARKVTNAVREFSDKRELVPRFIHFSEAFRQEAQGLWKRGMRDLKKIEQRATDAALWRVNQYKFDYSALMPWEQAGKTLLFPFYTYMRKAIPLLTEQMFTNPHMLSTLNRFFEYNDGSAADRFNALNIPQWVKDIGYANITDSEEPWVVRGDILPLNSMNVLSSSSVPEFSNNVIGSLNPILQGPMELGTGQQIYEDRPLNSSTWDYILNAIPGYSDIQQEIVRPIQGESDKPFWVSRLNERLTGLGLPIGPITARQQQQQQQENRDIYIDDPLKQFNNSQDRFNISVTSNFMYRIRDEFSGDVLGEFPTPQMAIEFAQRLPGADWQMPFVDPRQAPTAQNVFDAIAGN